jgi:hypothetical protein
VFELEDIITVDGEVASLKGLDGGNTRTGARTSPTLDARLIFEGEEAI